MITPLFKTLLMNANILTKLIIKKQQQKKKVQKASADPCYAKFAHIFLIIIIVY